MNSRFHLHYRMRLCASAITLVSLTTLFGATASASGNSSAVTVHKHVNFRGHSLSVGEGEVTIQQLRSSVGNDRISSISIEPGYMVEACQHSRLRGRCDIFTSNVSDLRTISFNDAISSLRVSRTSEPAVVTAYQHVGFRGRSLSTNEPGIFTIQDLRDTGLGNDVISSIRIADGYSVHACEHSRYGGSGRCVDFTSTISDLRSIHFNDTISYLRISRISDEPTNQPPELQVTDLRLPIIADMVSQFTLADNVTSPDGDQLVFALDRDGDNPGTLTLIDTATGRFEFDPAGDFDDLLAGEEEVQSFTYTVSDGINPAVTGTVTLTVTGTAVPIANRAPSAPDVTAGSTDADTMFNIDISDVPSDPDGTAIMFVGTSDLMPLKGDLTDNGDGTFIFDPSNQFTALPSGMSEVITFQYTVTDGELTDTGTVTITVEGTSDTTTMPFVVGADGPGGGRIFLVNDDGTGLEFANSIPGGFLSTSSWGCIGTEENPIDTAVPNSSDGISLFDNNDNLIGPVDSGSSSTALLVDEGCSPAAMAADNFSTTLDNGEIIDDWYLPSSAELAAAVNFNGGAETDLWSSTEHTDDLAWTITPSGTLNLVRKDASGIAVLPIRSF